MSNYNNLKTSIDANIKQNGNQEITGPILNSVLNQMVNILGTGYQFAGVATLEPATDPGTPDAKVFYIANGKGTYTNFGGLEVTEGDVVVLYWDTAWHKVSTGIASQEKLSELEGRTNALDETINGAEKKVDVNIAPPAEFIGRGWNFGNRADGASFTPDYPSVYSGIACYRLAVTAGQKYKIKGYAASNYNGLYVITNKQGVILSHLYNNAARNEVTIDVTEDGTLYINLVNYDSSIDYVRTVDTVPITGLVEKVGDIKELKTENKDSIVNAVNGIVNRVDTLEKETQSIKGKVEPNIATLENSIEKGATPGTSGFGKLPDIVLKAGNKYTFTVLNPDLAFALINVRKLDGTFLFNLVCENLSSKSVTYTPETDIEGLAFGLPTDLPEKGSATILINQETELSKLNDKIEGLRDTVTANNTSTTTQLSKKVDSITFAEEVERLQREINSKSSVIENNSIGLEKLTLEAVQFIGSGGSVTNNVDGEDLKVDEASGTHQIKFADRIYGQRSGKGSVILRENFVNGVNTLTLDMFPYENTRYEIRYDYSLNGQNLAFNKKGITLVFNGGKISNGTLTGNDTLIIANDYEQIFDVSTKLIGNWLNTKVSVCWFGADATGTKDSYAAITSAIGDNSEQSSFKILYFPCGKFKTSSTININRIIDVEMEGKADVMNNSFYTSPKCAMLYTTNNCTVLKFDADDAVEGGMRYQQNFHLRGGLIDCTLVDSYNQSAVVISNQNGVNLFGVYVETTIKGNGNATGTAIEFCSYGSFTNIETRCTIRNFMNGIYVHSVGADAYITSFFDYSDIKQVSDTYINLEGGSYGKICGIYQCNRNFSSSNNGAAVIYCGTSFMEFNGIIWDLGAHAGYLHHQYAVKFSSSANYIYFTGTFKKYNNSNAIAFEGVPFEIL